jgi:hypothetical protein
MSGAGTFAGRAEHVHGAGTLARRAAHGSRASAVAMGSGRRVNHR